MAGVAGAAQRLAAELRALIRTIALTNTRSIFAASATFSTYAYVSMILKQKREYSQFRFS